MASTSTKEPKTVKTTAVSPGNGKQHIVARPGFVEIYLIVHGATSLPSRSDGHDPVPFASLKSIADERDKKTAQSSTHATVRPTHSPVWEEILTMEVPETDVDEEEVILTISDNVSKEKLVTYRVPITNFASFHPYHLELIQPTKSIGSGIRAYVTLQRLGSYLPRLKSFGFCGLEVVLRGFHAKLNSPSGPLLAVARIVPDYSVYKERILSKQSAGITTSTVTLPSPHPSAFEVPTQHIQGFPQITTASTDEDKPVWDHAFLFSGHDTATMFTRHSALVLEYYAANTSMSSITWVIRNPIGFSVVLLDEEVFEALRSENGRLGIRIDDLLVQSTEFATEEGVPGVDLSLRLINSERPDAMNSVSDFSLLPTLDSMRKRHPILTPITDIGGPAIAESVMTDELPTSRDDLVDPTPTPALYDRKKTQILANEEEYPPSDILETIFPDVALQDRDTKTKSKVNPHHAKELQKLKETVRKMASDIGELKATIQKLQEENRALKKQLVSQKNLADIIQSDLNTGTLTIEQLAEKYVATKAQLEAENAELKKYKDKVQKLQNQLIKANDREKKYLSNTLTAESPDVDKKLHEKQARIKKLETTAVQQEKVIAKMEKLLADSLRNEEKPKPSKIVAHRAERSDKSATEQATQILMQENSRLRMELEDMKLMRQRFDTDNVQLQARLDQARNRVSSLEMQLNQNSRRWAQEKHELSIRLQEHRNGIMRTDQPIGEALRYSTFD